MQHLVVGPAPCKSALDGLTSTRDLSGREMREKKTKKTENKKENDKCIGAELDRGCPAPRVGGPLAQIPQDTHARSTGTWHLDDFALARASGGRSLSTMSRYIFVRSGLVDQLRLDRYRPGCASVGGVARDSGLA